MTKNQSEIVQHNMKLSSNIATLMHIICITGGIGILGLAEAVKEGGFISVSFIFLAMIISMYTGRLSIQCLYVKQGERLGGYVEIGEAAFGRGGRWIVGFFFYSIMFGASCLYIMFIGITISNIFKTKHYLGIIFAALIVLIPILLFNNISEVSALSLIGFVCTVVCIMIIVIVGFIEFDPKNKKYKIIDIQNIPISIATISFSYGGSVVYPHIEKNMKDKSKFNRILYIGLLIISLLNVIAALCGYIIYGDTTMSPIVKNIENVVVRHIVEDSMALHLLFATPILLCSLCGLLETNIIKTSSNKKDKIKRIIFRTLIVTLLALVASFIPYFDKFMAFVGAFSNCAIAFVVPVICHIKMFGLRNNSRTILDYLMIPITLIIGISAFIFGSIQAVIELHDEINK